MTKIHQILSQSLTPREISFIVGIPLFFFIVLEILLRQFGFPHRHLKLGVVDAEMGWIMNPPSQTFSPPTGKPDLIFVGDQLVYEDAFNPRHFIQLLQKDYHRKILTLAGNGYGTDQELIQLDNLKQELPHSALVVLNFNLFDDFIDNQSRNFSHTGFPPKPFFELNGKQLMIKKGHVSDNLFYFWALILQDHCATYDFLKTVLRGLHVITDKHLQLAPQQTDLKTPPPSPEQVAAYLTRVQQSFPITGRLLKEMNQLVEKSLRSKLIILVHPHGYREKDTDVFEMDPSIQKFFKDLKLKVYDLGCLAKKKSFLYQDYALDRTGLLRKEGHLGFTIFLDELIQGKVSHPECFFNYEKKENIFVVP